MSLQDELEAASGPSCKLCAYLGTLASDQRAEWAAQLSRPVVEVGNTAVVSALHRRGVTITEVSVRRHRSRHV